MKNFITPALYVALVYALLFYYFDKVILSVIFAIVQMFILPATLIWAFYRYAKKRDRKYQKVGFYFAVIQSSLVIVDLIIIITHYPFVVKGMGLFLLINLIPVVVVLDRLGESQQPQ